MSYNNNLNCGYNCHDTVQSHFYDVHPGGAVNSLNYQSGVMPLPQTSRNILYGNSETPQNSISYQGNVMNQPVNVNQFIGHNFISNSNNVCPQYNNASVTPDANPPVFQKGSKFLDFILENSPYYVTNFEMSEEDKSYHGNKYDIGNLTPGHYTNEFCQTIDRWKHTPNQKAVEKMAKLSIFMGFRCRDRGVVSLVRILKKRLTMSSLTVSRRMSLLYLIHWIMAIETVNSEMRSPGRPFCTRLGEMLSKANVFCDLFSQASFEQRQELYSLRCRWDIYLSQKVLIEIDQQSFSIDFGRENNLPGNASSEPNNKFTNFNLTIDGFLCNDWCVEFSLNDKDKRKFTDKYAVKKGMGEGGNMVSIYNKAVTFKVKDMEHSIFMLSPSAGKEEYMEVAKEAFYVEEVFGKKPVADVAEFLIKQWDFSQTNKSFLERMKSLLLVHIILYAEANHSLYKNKPRIARPFCNAFGTDDFALKFRKLVTLMDDVFQHQRDTKQRIYWMRLRWDLCLLDECLHKIDEDGFWDRNGLNQEIPVHYNTKSKAVAVEPEEDNDDEVNVIAHIDRNKKKDEVAIVILHSSEDEDDYSDGEIREITPAHCNTKRKVVAVEPENDKDDEISIIACIDRNKEKDEVATITLHSSGDEDEYSDGEVRESHEGAQNPYIILFMADRSNGWTTHFFMDENCIAKLRQKYCLSKLRLPAETFHVKLFQTTVFEAFRTVNEQTFLRLAKEAFFIEAEFGYGAVIHITKFLVGAMQNGFDQFKASKLEIKRTSQLFAFLTLHIIIAIESVEPFIVPNVTQRLYIKEVEYYTGVSKAKKLIKRIDRNKNQQLRSELIFLTLTWSVLNKSRISKRVIAKFKENHNMENVFIKNVIGHVKRMYEKNREIFDQEMIATIKKSCKRKLEETEIESPIISLEKGPCSFTNPTSKTVAQMEKEKRKKKDEDLLAKRSKDLESLFAPDSIIKVIPAAPKNKTPEKVNLSDDSHGHNKSVLAGGNRSSSSSTISGLLGVNGQPLRQPGSKCDKAMEELRKMLQERNGGNKKGKEADEQVLEPRPRAVKEVQVNNFETKDFVDNLLTPTFQDFEIVYSEDGTAQVKFTHAA